jgi:putative oligomerization/nucleic acid binding protein
MFVRRRRPLMRAAVVGGTAYYAGKRSQEGQSREQEQEYRLQELEAQQAAAPPPAAPVPAAPAGPSGISNDAIEQLQQLAALKDQGVLTDEEFEVQKRRLLGTA